MEAGGKPSKGTPADQRLKENKPKITKAEALPANQPQKLAAK